MQGRCLGLGQFNKVYYVVLSLALTGCFSASNGFQKSVSNLGTASSSLPTAVPTSSPISSSLAGSKMGVNLTTLSDWSAVTSPSMFGTYNLSFNGMATVTGYNGEGTVQNYHYDPVSNLSTAQVVVSSGDQTPGFF